MAIDRGGVTYPTVGPRGQTSTLQKAPNPLPEFERTPTPMPDFLASDVAHGGRNENPDPGCSTPLSRRSFRVFCRCMERLGEIAVHCDHAPLSHKEWVEFVHRNGVLRQTARTGWRSALGETCRRIWCRVMCEPDVFGRCIWIRSKLCAR